MHEALRGAHGLPADRANVLGLTSRIFCSAKYVLFVQTGNHGDGESWERPT